MLYATQQSNLEPDDPQVSFLLQAWARVCKALGQEFVPYLEVVMPPLLQSASADPDMIVHDDGKLAILRQWLLASFISFIYQMIRTSIRMVGSTFPLVTSASESTLR